MDNIIGYVIFFILGGTAGIAGTLFYCMLKESDDQFDPHDPRFDYKDF
jgi:hypothetical protein